MKVKLIKTLKDAPGTKSFFWEPETKTEFSPGQYFYYTLPKLNYPDERGDTRHFTISSSPTEKYLRLTTRIRKKSGYKMTLDELKIGSEIEGEGPAGTFIYPNNEQVKQHQFFIAGGIGITPFRAMIKYSIDKKLNTPLFLIYSNSDSNFVFKEELDQMVKDDANLKVKYFNTSVSGHINMDILDTAIKVWGIPKNKSTFWIVGPPPFVNALEDEVEKIKIPTNSINTEKFTGY